MDSEESESYHPLQARLNKVRNQALFGLDTIPARKPSPYPEGKTIYHAWQRYVVQHGTSVTKYTKFSGGMGLNDEPNEAVALRYIKMHTTIPVPTVISSDWDRITMEYIEGETLRDAWPGLTDVQRDEIGAQLTDYMAQLRALSGDLSSNSIGRLDGQGALVPSTMKRSGGPFKTANEFHTWLSQPSGPAQQKKFWHEFTKELDSEYPVVFTHGDINSRNILVRDGRVVALLDWEFAGWYPSYWEYVMTMRRLDTQDWNTVGSWIQSLFARKYRREYLTTCFFINLA